MKIFFLIALFLFHMNAQAQNVRTPSAIEGNYIPSTTLMPSSVVDMWTLDVRFAQQKELLESLRAKRYTCERKSESLYSCRAYAKLQTLPNEIRSLLLSKVDYKRFITFAKATSPKGTLIHQSNNFKVWGFGNSVNWNGIQLSGYEIQSTPELMKISLHTETRQFLGDLIIPAVANSLLQYISVRKFESQNHWKEFQAYNVWFRNK